MQYAVFAMRFCLGKAALSLSAVLLVSSMANAGPVFVPARALTDCSAPLRDLIIRLPGVHGDLKYSECVSRDESHFLSPEHAGVDRVSGLVVSNLPSTGHSVSFLPFSEMVPGPLSFASDSGSSRAAGNNGSGGAGGNGSSGGSPFRRIEHGFSLAGGTFARESSQTLSGFGDTSFAKHYVPPPNGTGSPALPSGAIPRPIFGESDGSIGGGISPASSGAPGGMSGPGEAAAAPEPPSLGLIATGILSSLALWRYRGRKINRV